MVEPVADPKPKRAPRARAPSRKKVKELDAEVVAVEPTLEETTVEVTVPEEKLKLPAVVKEKVACPDCGKQMSAKTLKYSHAPNCTVKQINVKEEMLESLLEQRLSSVKQERLARKQAMVEKLISGAF
jgi:Zn finger protein HypA/HybF involved in hydrogenase expression